MKQSYLLPRLWRRRRCPLDFLTVCACSTFMYSNWISIYHVVNLHCFVNRRSLMGQTSYSCSVSHTIADLRLDGRYSNHQWSFSHDTFTCHTVWKRSNRCSLLSADLSLVPACSHNASVAPFSFENWNCAMNTYLRDFKFWSCWTRGHPYKTPPCH